MTLLFYQTSFIKIFGVDDELQTTVVDWWSMEHVITQRRCRVFEALS